MARTSILFDATRLMARAHRTTATGIDRVMLAYGRWLLSHPDIELIPVLAWRNRLTPLSLKRFRATIERNSREREAPSSERQGARISLEAALGAGEPSRRALRAGGPSRPNLSDASGYANLAGRLLSALAMKPRSGSIYLNVSLFGLEDPRLLTDLRRAGVECVVMIHDVIPITHPELCAPGARALHVRRMRGALASAKAIIANSHTTAHEIVSYAAKKGLPTPKVTPVLLGLEQVFLHRPEPIEAARPYFICIGTIEARKNLAFLLSVWRRLWEANGEATPTLVLVGRRGWETEAVIDHLERSPAARRFVHEVAHLNDRAVARLIAGASALLAPSMVEGFDLPVMEAIAMGTPVIASDIPVHRELAANATLIDPLDGPAWAEAVQTAAGASGARAAGSVPTWDAHFDAVAEILGIASVGSEKLEADLLAPDRRMVAAT